MKRQLLSAALAFAVGIGAITPANARERKAAETAPFAALKTMPADQAQEKTWTWLAESGKGDDATQTKFKAIWADDTRPLAERVADSLALGDTEAARLLGNARDAEAAAPTEVPALLLDAKRSSFFRANLTLAYAKALSQRNVYEEALAALKLTRPGDVVDPAAYYFHRALAEHALGKRTEARRSLTAVREDVADAPARYLQLAALMEHEMRDWKDRDLGGAARRMRSIGRRLVLARGGPTTQKMQKEVVAILDDLIKDMEKEPMDPEPGPRPPRPRTPRPRDPGENPQPLPPAPGIVPDKHLAGLAKQWGKLPDAERAKAIAGLTRDLPPEYREVIERYFKELARAK